MPAARPPIPVFAILAAIAAVLFGAWIPLEFRPIESIWQAISSEPYGALFGHAIIGFLVCTGLIVTAVKRRVLPLPQVKLLIPLAFLELSVLATILVSEYKHISISGFFEWSCYGAALILTVGTVGRGPGIRAVLGAMTVAITFMGVYGIFEWVASAQIGNPSWRIFAHTLGPNVAAAYFAIGAMGALAFLRDKERIVVLLAGLGAFLCLTALLMTGSKGGFLATLAAGAFFVLWQLRLTLSPQGKENGRTFGPIVATIVVVILAFGFTTLASKRFSSAGSGTLGRVAEAGATQEQSAGFRKLLWQGTAKLIGERPYGYGLGTYRFYSAKPGLTTPTQLSHNTYLQLAMEATPIALLALLGFLVLVARQVFKGTSGQATDIQDMKAAVTAAIIAVAIHSVIDSDLQIFGVGILFFMLCGLAIQLSTDSSAPEFMHPGLRRGVIAGATVIPLAMLYFGVIDLKHGLFLANRGMTADQAKSDAQSLAALAPLDSRVAYLNYQVLEQLQAPLNERQSVLRKAISLGPTFAMYRAMAELCARNPGSGDPVAYLDKALALDPNNLPSLKKKLEILAERDPELAKQTAQRMVDIESSTYYKTRSLPEVIPVETFIARAYLAQSLQGTAKAEMLEPAIKGYQEYAKITVPRVIEFAKANLPDGFGGINPQEAKQALEEAQRVMADYSKLSPSTPWLGEAESDVRKGLEALASLSQ